MILAWPLLMLLAGILFWRHRGADGGRGGRWFLAWTMAGFLMSISLITGLSIGLLILPFAAWALIWVSRRAPHVLEASGFLVGILATVLLVAVLST